MKSLGYINMTPLNIYSLRLSEQANNTLQDLDAKDVKFAIYLHRKSAIDAASVFETYLPSGSYSIFRTDTKRGALTQALKNNHNV